MYIYISIYVYILISKNINSIRIRILPRYVYINSFQLVPVGKWYEF